MTSAWDTPGESRLTISPVAHPVMVINTMNKMSLLEIFNALFKNLAILFTIVNLLILLVNCRIAALDEVSAAIPGDAERRQERQD